MSKPRIQPIGIAEYRLEVKKSRFIALATAIDDPAAALGFIDRQRRPDASHHCWAYRWGAHSRCHDDGEPGGTAGRPILKALETQGFDRSVVLVLRWFGGIKLGPGGLLRAYGAAAAECLRQAPRQALIDYACWQLECALRDLPLIQARLVAFQAEILDQCYTNGGARLTLRVPRPQSTALNACLLAITRHPEGLRELPPARNAHPHLF